MAITATGPAPGSESGTPSVSSEQANKAATRTTRNRFRVAAIFSDFMVLQRGKDIRVFGTGTSGTLLHVKLISRKRFNVVEESVQGLPNHIQHNPTDDMNTTVENNTVLTPQQSVGDTVVENDSETVQSWYIEATAAIADNGTWEAILPAITEPLISCELTVSDDTESITYHNVAVGEVWFASGQSNMELELRNSWHPAQVIEESSDELLRFYNTPKTGSVDIAAEDTSTWQTARPQTVGTMSAVAYYFAARLRKQFGSTMPIGIVDCYVGGTSVTGWMSEAVLQKSEAGRGYLERYHQLIDGKTADQCQQEFNQWQVVFDAWNGHIDQARKENPDVTWDELNATYGTCPWPPPMTPFSQFRPTGPFGAMITRVAPYNVRGVLWYQGEEDELYCDSYAELLTAMIQLWRQLWKDHTLPFKIVQLPRWIDKAVDTAGTDEKRWPVLRAAQQAVADTVPHVALISAIDCGEYDNIHPLDKRTVGERLSEHALHQEYGFSEIAADYPRITQAKYDAKTSTITVTLQNTQGLHFGHYSGDLLGENIAFPMGTPTSESGVVLYTNSDTNDEAKKYVQVAANTSINSPTNNDTQAKSSAAGNDNSTSKGNANVGISKGIVSDNTGKDIVNDDTRIGIASGNTLQAALMSPEVLKRSALASGFEVLDAHGTWTPVSASIVMAKQKAEVSSSLIEQTSYGSQDLSAVQGEQISQDITIDQNTNITRILSDSSADQRLVKLDVSHMSIGDHCEIRYAWVSWGPAPLFNAIAGTILPALPCSITTIQQHSSVKHAHNR